jgi:hypothetical protein
MVGARFKGPDRLILLVIARSWRVILPNPAIRLTIIGSAFEPGKGDEDGVMTARMPLG